MKQTFFDKSKAVFIKVFPDSSYLEREIFGAKNLASVVKVPQYFRLDCRILAISLLEGFLGYQIKENDLNVVVAEFLGQKLPINQSVNFSIFTEIELLENFFKKNKLVLKKLFCMKKMMKQVKLYPVHGDLQKQNIVVSDGKLGLVDFEHFIVAPKELELCNSLFFDDGNCLNVKSIINLLPKNFINVQMLKLCLKFYMLKQVSLGMDFQEAENKLKSALKRLEKKEDLLKILPNHTMERVFI